MQLGTWMAKGLSPRGRGNHYHVRPSAETIEVLTLHDDAQSPLLPGLAADVAACFDAPTVGA